MTFLAFLQHPRHERPETVDHAVEIDAQHPLPVAGVVSQADLAMATPALLTRATEDVIYLLNGLGIETGVALDALGRCCRVHQPDSGPAPCIQSGVGLLAKRAINTLGHSTKKADD